MEESVQKSVASTMIGLALVPVLSCLAALAWFEAMEWNQPPISARWTAAVFLLPIIGLTQPLIAVPAYLLIRQRHSQLARGLLIGTLTTLAMCLLLGWIEYGMMKGLSGLR